jgi:3-(3-hydroxy-phenyl)propionate hydroxylase
MSEATGHVPVIISGAGPTGLTLALALAKAGVRSLILEKKTELSSRSRATLITPSTLENFYKLGIIEQFMAQGERNDAIKIVRSTDHETLLTFDFSELADETPTPYAVALSQDRTERILLDSVLATGMAEVAFGTAFERFEQLENRVRVYGVGGRVIECDWLIGADGAHSAVREQLGWQLEGKTYDGRAALADVRIAPEFDFTGGWLLDPKGDSFTFGVRFADGIWRLMQASVPDTLTDDQLPLNAQKVAEGMFGKGAWQETIWTAAYRKHNRRSPSYVDGRIVLAGDAAHLNSPAGGQGLNAGIADAVALSEALIAALAKPDEGQTHIAAYEHKRIIAFDEHISGFTDSMEKMETLPAWVRNIAFAGLPIVRAVGIEKVVMRKLANLPDEND